MINSNVLALLNLSKEIDANDIESVLIMREFATELLQNSCEAANLVKEIASIPLPIIAAAIAPAFEQCPYHHGARA